MRPKRLKTFDYLGCYHYSLTFCAFRRNRYFEDSELVGLIEEQLSRTATEYQFEELAYCFMPDHLHLLLAGLREDASLIPCVEVMRQRSSRAAKTAQGIQLWQDGYFERVLRDDEQLEVAAQYIFENPVRANLVGNAKDWPHSGGRFWRLYS
jgi:REP-associated tyrosine transposase